MPWIKKKMKRKIPPFRLSVRPGIKLDYNRIAYTPGVREAILEETFKAIKDGIDRNKQTTSIFEIAHANYYVNLDRDKWKINLENIMHHYAEKEDYIKCAECRDLIQKL